MIVGRVNARLEATLPLQIEHASGQMHTIYTVIDTGFTGDLTLRAAQIASLGLRFLGEIVMQLADGTQLRTDVHDAILWWDGYPIQVRVQAVETDSLLGTRLMAGHELKAQFIPGGTVTIERIP